ncbi:MAG: hypothetical protein U0168_05015 [Nannocystaceae bacterium]
MESSCIDEELGESVGAALARGTTAAAGRDIAVACGDGEDVVYGWTAPHAGRWVADLAGSSYDTALAVLDADCGGLERACNDDTSGSKQSRAVFDATAGQQFAIVVTGNHGASGAYVLGISEFTVDPSACVDVELASKLGQGVALGTTDDRGDDVEPSCAPSGNDVVHEWTAPHDGTFAFSAPDGNVAIALLDASCDGDELACAAPLEAAVGATAALTEGEHVLVVVDSGAVAANYRLDIRELSSGCFDGDLGSATGVGVAVGTTVGAGDDVPAQACGGGGEEVVWRWTAPTSGSFSFDLSGSSFDTVLTVQQGDCGGATLGCNDDGIGSASAVTVDLLAGQSVAIVIDSYSLYGGNYMLNIASAAGSNSCVDIELGTSGGPLVGTTAGASDELWPSCAGVPSGDVEIEWTAPYSGDFTATLTAAPGTVLALYSDCSGIEYGCAADVLGTGVTQLALYAAAGETWILAVDGNGTTGPFDLTIE